MFSPRGVFTRDGKEGEADALEEEEDRQGSATEKNDEKDDDDDVDDDKEKERLDDAKAATAAATARLLQSLSLLSLPLTSSLSTDEGRGRSIFGEREGA